MFIRHLSNRGPDIESGKHDLGAEQSAHKNLKMSLKKIKTARQLREGEVHINWPDEESRARRVVKRSNSRVTYKYPSSKSARGGSLHAESELELNFYMLMDANPKVLKIWDQPAEIHFFINGKTHIHYPDALVETSDNRTFYEIKSESDPEIDWARTREDHLKQALLIHELNYSLVLGVEIKREPRLRNAKTLLRHGRHKPSVYEFEKIHQIFEKHLDLSWHDILAGKIKDAEVSVIAAMILSGDITYNDEIPLGPETRLQFQRNLQIQSGE